MGLGLNKTSAQIINSDSKLPSDFQAAGICMGRGADYRFNIQRLVPDFFILYYHHMLHNKVVAPQVAFY